MYHTISQAFVILFLTAYSVLLIALGWWALRARLGPPVKNGIALVLTWAIATFHFPLWRIETRKSRISVGQQGRRQRTLLRALAPTRAQFPGRLSERNVQRKTLKEVA